MRSEHAALACECYVHELCLFLDLFELGTDATLKVAPLQAEHIFARCSSAERLGNIHHTDLECMWKCIRRCIRTKCGLSIQTPKHKTQNFNDDDGKTKTLLSRCTLVALYSHLVNQKNYVLAPKLRICLFSSDQTGGHNDSICVAFDQQKQIYIIRTWRLS